MLFVQPLQNQILYDFFPACKEHHCLPPQLLWWQRETQFKPRDEVSCEIKYKNGISKTIKVLCRIDTQNEVEYYKNGGILQYVLRNMLN